MHSFLLHLSLSLSHNPSFRLPLSLAWGLAIDLLLLRKAASLWFLKSFLPSPWTLLTLLVASSPGAGLYKTRQDKTVYFPGPRYAAFLDSLLALAV